jgi:outer membrane protein assembly factor BamB
VVEPDDGRLLWRVDVRQPLVDQVVAVTTEAGPRFVVASTTGLLFQVDSEGQVVNRTSLARRITDLRPLDPHRLLAVTKGTLLAAALGRVGAGE